MKNSKHLYFPQISCDTPVHFRCKIEVIFTELTFQPSFIQAFKEFIFQYQSKEWTSEEWTNKRSRCAVGKSYTHHLSISIFIPKLCRRAPNSCNEIESLPANLVWCSIKCLFRNSVPTLNWTRLPERGKHLSDPETESHPTCNASNYFNTFNLCVFYTHTLTLFPLHIYNMFIIGMGTKKKPNQNSHLNCPPKLFI